MPMFNITSGSAVMLCCSKISCSQAVAHLFSWFSS